MSNCKLNYDESSSKFESTELFYNETKDEVSNYEVEIEDEKYSKNKPRRVTIKARIIDD